MQDLVEKAAHKKCFEFAIIKSDTKLYVVKYCESKNGCKLSVRDVKLKNSNCFLVRTYNKRHTCSGATTSKSKKDAKAHHDSCICIA